MLVLISSVAAHTPYAREVQAALSDEYGACAKRERMLRGVSGVPVPVAGKQLLRRIDVAIHHVENRTLEKDEGLRDLPSLLSGLASVESLYEDYRARYGLADRCYLFTQEQAPELSQLIAQNAEKLDLLPPHLLIADAPHCPLIVTGGIQNDAAVLLMTTGFLNQSTSGEVAAVINHELGHLAEDHIPTRMFLNLLLMILLFVVFLALLYLYVWYIDIIPMQWKKIALLCSVIAISELGEHLPKIADFVTQYYAHQCEFEADAVGARQESTDAMKHALEQLERLHERYMARYRKTYEQAEQMIVHRAARWPWLQDYLRNEVSIHRALEDRSIAVRQRQHPSFKQRTGALHSL